jgi:hypothetical protein
MSRQVIAQDEPGDTSFGAMLEMNLRVAKADPIEPVLTNGVLSEGHLCLDDAIVVEMLPQLDIAEARFLQELCPLRPRALHTTVEGHHDQVEPCLDLFRSGVRQNKVMDKKLRVARFHGTVQALQYHQAILVRPIMQNMVEEVSAGACQ